MAARKILLVDDDTELLELLQVLFIKEGYEVRTCESSEHLQQIAEQFEPDMVLLDLKLKNESGLDVARKLKNWKETHHIPIVFMSACEDTEIQKDAYMVGAIDYITKPISMVDIISRTKPVIEIGKLQKLVDKFARSC